eukprot:scaffold128973_cov69-Phaeocystis_antarctica.AAC.1
MSTGLRVEKLRAKRSCPVLYQITASRVAPSRTRQSCASRRHRAPTALARGHAARPGDRRLPVDPVLEALSGSAGARRCEHAASKPDGL